jgi:hypothetical protein
VDADHISERDVRALWLAGVFRKTMLRTEEGVPVEVLFTGVPTGGTGPDLIGARVRIGGRERRGDVELHLSTAGWRAHGHQHDGSYRNVILHVALHRAGASDGPRLPYGGEPIPEVVLESFLEGGTWECVRKVRRLAVGAAVGGSDPQRAGAQRFRRKVERYRLLLGYEDPDALHFVESMRALGFGPNTASFVELARRAGPDPSAWAEAAGRVPWVRQGVRPANDPTRRLRQFAPYVARSPRPFAELCRLVGEQPDDRALVRVLADRFGLGRERGLQAVFSVDLPMAATRPEFAERMDRIDATHPPLAWTRPARLARGGGESIRTARQQMGLIERYRRRIRGIE